MSTYVSDAVQAAMDTARVTTAKRQSKLRVETAEGYYRILEFWETGFSVAASDAPNLRGFVDLYEGSQHLFQCLIVASRVEGDRIVFEFKRATAVVDHPPRDFVEEAPRPIGLLTQL